MITIGHAQIQPQQTIVPKFPDTLIFKKFKPRSKPRSLQFFPKVEPYSYNMPLAGSMPKKFIYLGNNENGFDVYQTVQDNMYILKPDSTFVSNMPIIKMTVENERGN